MRRRLRWGARGIQNIRETAIERFEANNPVFGFLRDMFPNGGIEIGAMSLYEQFIDYCKRNGRRSEYSNTKFGTILGTWERFGVTKAKTPNGRFYSFPKPEALLEAGLVPLAVPPASQADHGRLQGSDGLVAGSNPVPEPSVQGLTGYDPPPLAIAPTARIESPPPSQPVQPCKIPSQSESQPDMEPAMDRVQPCNPPFKEEGPSLKKKEKKGKIPVKRRPFRPLLKPGDLCRYKGPEGAMNVTCRGKTLTVLAVDYKAGEATIRSHKWPMGLSYPVPLEHLRRE